MRAYSTNNNGVGARGLSFRGPLMITGFGYDLDGNQVGSGNHSETYKTGPVDLLWDDQRKVWSSHGVMTGTINGTINGKSSGTLMVNSNLNIPVYNWFNSPITGKAVAMFNAIDGNYNVIQNCCGKQTQSSSLYACCNLGADQYNCPLYLRFVSPDLSNLDPGEYVLPPSGSIFKLLPSIDNTAPQPRPIWTNTFAAYSGLTIEYQPLNDADAQCGIYLNVYDLNPGNIFRNAQGFVTFKSYFTPISCNPLDSGDVVIYDHILDIGIGINAIQIVRLTQGQ